MIVLLYVVGFYFFFFNDTATTEIYTLSLHDALPIYKDCRRALKCPVVRGKLHGYPAAGRTTKEGRCGIAAEPVHPVDRKSTRLNSSHANISYAVFCLKKKKKTQQ